MIKFDTINNQLKRIAPFEQMTGLINDDDLIVFEHYMKRRSYIMSNRSDFYDDDYVEWCSHCGYEFDYEDPFNFCPKCGFELVF